MKIIKNLYVTPNIKVEENPHVSLFLEITFPYDTTQKLMSKNGPKIPSTTAAAQLFSESKQTKSINSKISQR